VGEEGNERREKGGKGIEGRIGGEVRKRGWVEKRRGYGRMEMKRCSFLERERE
jgi:hypothetical protein